MASCESCLNNDTCKLGAIKRFISSKTFNSIQKDCPFYKDCSLFVKLPYEFGDTVYVYANNKAEKTKIKAFKIYDDQILVYTTIGEFDANRVYKNIVDLYANECRETSFG